MSLDGTAPASTPHQSLVMTRTQLHANLDSHSQMGGSRRNHEPRNVYCRLHPQPGGADSQPGTRSGRAWLANADAREKQLQPVSDALFDRATLQPGECVLDVGVGSGPTTGQAWEAVRPGGSVTGIDIAPPMIAAARQRIMASEIEWIVGDAASYFSPRT